MNRNKTGGFHKFSGAQASIVNTPIVNTPNIVPTSVR